MVEFTRKVEKVSDLLFGHSVPDPAMTEHTPTTAELMDTPFSSALANAPFLSEFPAVSNVNLAGLTPPSTFDPMFAQLAQEMHQDAFHIPELLTPELHSEVMAGTIISVGVFNAAFLPILPTTSFRTPLADKAKTNAADGSVSDAEEAIAFFANLGLNKKLLAKAKRIARNQVGILIWLSGFTKTVVQTLRVLRRETAERRATCEDAENRVSQDASDPPKKARYRLKI